MSKGWKQYSLNFQVIKGNARPLLSAETGQNLRLLTITIVVRYQRMFTQHKIHTHLCTGTWADQPTKPYQVKWWQTSCPTESNGTRSNYANFEKSDSHWMARETLLRSYLHQTTGTTKRTCRYTMESSSKETASLCRNPWGRSHYSPTFQPSRYWVLFTQSSRQSILACHERRHKGSSNQKYWTAHPKACPQPLHLWIVWPSPPQPSLCFEGFKEHESPQPSSLTVWCLK